jgi:uncharacterized membrane protein YdjX (TVP38/TMEM64 family)
MATQMKNLPPAQSETTAETKKAGLWRPITLLATIVGIIILAQVFDLGDKFGALRDWIATLGPWGPVIFVLLYSMAVVAALPGSVLTVSAGVLFGSFVGVITVSIASTLGASFSFLIARYFARDAVANWLSTKDTFRKLDKLTELHGGVIVALTRLAPIFPFNLLNYGFGLTNVPFRTYVLYSWLFMLPGTVLYVVGADALTKGMANGQMPWGLVALLSVMLVVVALMLKSAKKKLQAKDLSPAATVNDKEILK